MDVVILPTRIGTVANSDFTDLRRTFVHVEFIYEQAIVSGVDSLE